MCWDGTERRRHKRQGIRGSIVRFKPSSLFSFLAPYSEKLLLLDFSEGGCHFIAKTPLEPGTALDLELEAPRIRGAVHARGRVVWSRRSEHNDVYHAGVEITSISSGSRRVLKNMLDGALLDNVDISTRTYLKEIEKL